MLLSKFLVFMGKRCRFIYAFFFWAYSLTLLMPFETTDFRHFGLYLVWLLALLLSPLTVMFISRWVKETLSPLQIAGCKFYPFLRRNRHSIGFFLYLAYAIIIFAYSPETADFGSGAFYRVLIQSLVITVVLTLLGGKPRKGRTTE